MKMNRRRVIMTTVLLIGVLLLVLFVAFGIPLIRDTFSTPIPGLPTTDGSANTSLQARYTQTALAKQSSAGATATPANGTP